MDNEPVKRKRGRPPKNAPKVAPELVSKPKRKRRTAEQIHEDFTAKQAKLLKVDKSAKKKPKQKDEKHCMKESFQKPQVLIFNTDKKILEEKKEKSSQVKTEFDENDESSNEASMVEKDDDIRSFNYRTTIPEQPKILKKFRPPMSKYKLRELEALAAAEESTKIADDVATTGAASLRKKLPSTLDLDSYTSSDSFFSCSSEIQPTTPLSHLGVEAPNNDIAKFCQLNAWLASKQSRWCVKTKLSLNKMLYKESLIATFKCMARNCSFTTISIKNFKKHLAHHEAESDVDSIYYCPYCFFKGDSSESLVKHCEIHQHDKYQCGYCFYRSAIDQSCWEHVKSHHSQYPLIVYDCPLEPCLDASSKAASDRLHRKRECFVRPLICTCCDLKFYLIDKYEQHLDEHTQDAGIEPEAKQLTLKDLKNYQKDLSNNKVGLFECLFCKFGTDQRSELRSHMQEHPREPKLSICQRKFFLTSNDPQSIESTVISELPKRSDVEVIPFNVDLNVLRNNSNVLKISD